jgi:ketosteroid isomerase-like protein
MWAEPILDVGCYYCHTQHNARGYLAMPDNSAVIYRLYDAFAKLDAAGMAGCYADDAVFEDEIFSLQGKREVMGMWSMLIDATRAKGRDVWQLRHEGVLSSEDRGEARWIANYRFSATGRMVENRIQAQFRFNADGLIVIHRDHFDFWKWSSQALGPAGLLLGWSELLRNKVKAQAMANLNRYLSGGAN